MVEFKESQNSAWWKTLNQIRERAQRLFLKPVEVRYHESDPEDFSCSYVEIDEISRAYWFGLIPHSRRRRLLQIHARGDEGIHFFSDKIECQVFERSILGMIKEELGEYAETFQVSTVEFA